MRKTRMAGRMLAVAAVLLPLAASYMQLTSPLFLNFKDIPDRYSCACGPDNDPLHPNYEGPSPPVNFIRVPEKTRSFVLMVDDIDTKMVNWLVTDIPGETKGLPDDASKFNMPIGAREWPNSYGTFGYARMCPSDGKTHSYRFRLYSMRTETTRILLPPQGIGYLSDLVEQQLSGLGTVLGQQDTLYVSNLVGKYFLTLPRPADIDCGPPWPATVDVFPPPPVGTQRYIKVSEVLKPQRPHYAPRGVHWGDPSNNTIAAICERMRKTEGVKQSDHSATIAQLCWYAGSENGPTVSVQGADGFQGDVDPSKIGYEFRPRGGDTGASGGSSAAATNHKGSHGHIAALVEGGGAEAAGSMTTAGGSKEEAKKQRGQLQAARVGDLVRIKGLPRASDKGMFNGLEGVVDEAQADGSIRLVLQGQKMTVAKANYEVVPKQGGDQAQLRGGATGGEGGATIDALMQTEPPATIQATNEQRRIKATPPLIDEVEESLLDDVIDWSCEGGAGNAVKDDGTTLALRSPVLDSCARREGQHTYPAIPKEFACDPLTAQTTGRASPPLVWRYNGGGGDDDCTVKSWVLVIDDVLSHKLQWVVTNIKADARSVPVGLSGDNDAMVGTELLNSFRRFGYEAPCFDVKGPRAFRATIFGRPGLSTHLPHTDKQSFTSLEALLKDSCARAELSFGVQAPHTDTRKP